MPNRILREGIITSERVNALSWEGEVFYRRLMSVVDDFGMYTANAALVRAALYPLKLETIREANLERLISESEKAGLIRLYEVQGKRYLEVLNFNQQLRAKNSKYPAPEQGTPCGPPPETDEEQTEKKTLKKFQKPTPDEVTAYGLTIDYPIDGNAFFDFYESKGWKIGNGPMKDWKAAVRTWKKRNGQTQGVSEEEERRQMLIRAGVKM